MKKKEVKWGVSETKKYDKSKKKHGGKRKGSGQPKKEPTKVMRIPISLVSHVKFIKKFGLPKLTQD